MMGVDDVFMGFAVSYLAGSLPSLKELFKKDDDLSIQERVNRSYEAALAKWCANDDIRKRMASQWFDDLNRLASEGNCRKGADLAALTELAGLWADEIRKDDVLAHYLLEIEIKKVGDKIEQLDEYLRNREKLDETHQIKRGLKEHKPVDNYIRRFCNSDNAENFFFYYTLNLRQRHCLAEYVTGTLEIDNNKYILYSSAQTGKTTELKQLCWELQQCGLYLPVMYEVRNNTQLKRDDLPDFRFTDGKEVVVVIDALDEVNGKKYEDLLEEICGYAYDHPEIKTVLSCRSNYRRERQLSQFCELYLEELSYDDVREHINKELGKNNGLMNFIDENNLLDFARNPFFLNVLIDAYRNNSRKMPKTKAEVYRLFIEKSYHTEKEEKNIHQTVMHSFEDSVVLLERVAIGLSLMNVQTLSAEELGVCLNNDEKNVTECLRYDLIRCENGRYSFKHNAFREWLVANYLHGEGIDRAKQLATHPNGRIKPEWYNIVMLWVSMYGLSDKDTVGQILDWLKSASLDVIIHIDKGMVDKVIRDEVFKGLMLEYKSLGIRMSNILQQEYKILLNFAQSDETVRFMIDEMNAASVGSAYYADLMCLCFFLNWDILAFQNPDLVEELFQTILSKTKDALEDSKPHELSLLYLEIPFFAKREYFERIFAIVGTSNHYEAVSSMLQLIGAANVADEYLDYILNKEKLVCNQHKGNTIHLVSRDSVYFALEKVETPESLKRVLAHKFPTNVFYHDEWREYNKMIKSLLMKLARCVKEGREDLVETLENYYSNTFKDYYIHFDRNGNARELLLMIRQCYLDAGCREKGKNDFYKDLNVIFSPEYIADGERDKVRSVFNKAALWITCDDVKSDFSHFSATDMYDMAKANWYCDIPIAEVAECASELYRKVFPISDVAKKRCERIKRSFNDFTNYEVFRQEVLEMVSLVNDGMTRKEYRQRLEQLENGYNQYAFRFVSNFIDENNGYDVKSIVHGVKNRDFYEAFVMNEIAESISRPDPNRPVTDELKNRCFECARANVIKLCKNEQAYYARAALNLMLNGCFDVPNDLLLGLLDNADFHIAKTNPNDIYNGVYSLFDYIAERVDSDILAPAVVKKLQANISNEEYELANVFSKYIVDNKEERGYPCVLRYAMSKNYYANNILDLLIKNGLLLEEIKTMLQSKPVSDKLFTYEEFAREQGDVEWVRQHLEAEYKTCSGHDLYRSLRLLVGIGSLDALDYLMLHTDLVNDDDDFHFNYDNPNAIPNLCFLIQYCNEKHFCGHFMPSSILTSLERIAMKDRDAMDEVKRGLRNLTRKGEKYKYLNRYIMTFENKFYAAYSGISDINKVMVLIDSSAALVKSVSSDTHNDGGLTEVEDVLYISYNWESESQHIVDYFCFVLDNEKIGYKRDKKDCGYKDNIKEFMDMIRAGKTVVVVFSRPYLKSRNCMYELSGIMEDDSYKERILPVVTDDTIRESVFYLELVKYWKGELDQQSSLVDKLREIDSSMAKPEEEKMSEMEAVYNILPIVKNYLEWTNTENIDSLSSSHFKTIVDRLKKGDIMQ